MKIKTKDYLVKVKHDNGEINFIVTTLRGKDNAIGMVMQAEGCPRSAIVEVKKMKKEKQN